VARLQLSDQQWQRVEALLPECKTGGRPARNRRTLLNGMLWIVRTGALWRDVPEEFGPWQTVWRVFDQWNADGTLDKVLGSLQGEVRINTDLWCIDGTVIRAARCAAGGGKGGSTGARGSCIGAVSRRLYDQIASAV
jgi:transposase